MQAAPGKPSRKNRTFKLSGWRKFVTIHKLSLLREGLFAAVK